MQCARHGQSKPVIPGRVAKLREPGIPKSSAILSFHNCKIPGSLASASAPE